MRKHSLRVGRELLLSEYRISVLRTVVFRLRHRVGGAWVAHRFRFAGDGAYEWPAEGSLRFGVHYFGFVNGGEPSLIRNEGRLRVEGTTTIATGNRWHILPGGELIIGDRTFFSPRGLIVAGTAITIGAHSIIGWDTQIIDDDMHPMTAGGRPRVQRAPVTLGEHVWVGSGVKIFKGVTIADHCIVGGGSVVTRSCLEPGCLIAGNPAKVVRRDVTWS